MIRPAALAALCTVSACVDISEPPAVSDYNDHTVKVQGRIYALNGPGQTPSDYPEYTVAQETCATDGRHNVRYQGFRMVNSYTGEHVFTCTP